MIVEAHWEQQYLSLLQDALNGDPRPSRSGNVTSVTGRQIRVDLRGGKIPLPLTKRLNYAACFEELLWFLRGETNVATLRSSIWDAWADDEGNLGPIYGHQWRNWDGPDGPVDQFAHTLDRLGHNPFDRRHIVSAWNVGYLPHMMLPPCHLMWMLDVDSNYGVTMSVIQRSADLPVGVPFNLVSYAALAHLIASEMSCRYSGTPWHAKELVWFGNNCHVYQEQRPGVAEQLTREVPDRPVPRLHILNAAVPLLERLERGWTQDNYFHVTDYHPLGPIRFPVAV